MEKHFVNFNQSLALKEIGFDEPCISWYTVFGKFSNDYSNPKKYNSEYERGTFISAPLKSQVFEWFREKHNLYHEIRTFAWDYDKKELGFSIRTYLNPIDIETERLIHSEVYKTYEEAESACIDKLIEIIKDGRKIN